MATLSSKNCKTNIAITSFYVTSAFMRYFFYEKEEWVISLVFNYSFSSCLCVCVSLSRKIPPLNNTTNKHNNKQHFLLEVACASRNERKNPPEGSSFPWCQGNRVLIFFPWQHCDDRRSSHDGEIRDCTVDQLPGCDVGHSNNSLDTGGGNKICKVMRRKV